MPASAKNSCCVCQKKFLKDNLAASCGKGKIIFWERRVIYQQYSRPEEIKKQERDDPFLLCRL
jgi:hypothetical protein